MEIGKYTFEGIKIVLSQFQKISNVFPIYLQNLSENNKNE